jgi:hypothetical protein
MAIQKIPKDERERFIFGKFAPLAGIGIDPATIESRNPPEPDILCKVGNGQTLAFELCELIDSGYARTAAELVDTNSILLELASSLPPNIAAPIQASFPHGAHISFQFSQDLARRQRRSHALKALKWLALMDARPDGIYQPELPLRTAVRYIYVEEGGDMLRLESSTYSRLADSSIAAIRRKVGNPYESQHPIELLLYTEIDLIHPIDVWTPAVQPVILAELPKSRFQRVWLYKGGTNSVEFVYPPPE